MAVSRMTLLTCSALFAASALLAGCGQSDAQQAQQAGIQGVKQNGTAATKALTAADYRAFESELFRQMDLPADTRRQFRILETKDTPGGTYVLYSLPQNDGLAFAGRQGDGKVTIYQARWPLAVTDPAKDLVVVRAIPPNNGINAPYGVLAGRVYNPFIEYVEIAYRDGHVDRMDVSHNRGFIAVRKAFDTRFVQVRGYSTNGTPYWEIDTR
ncbi:hypothetical protein EV586_10558 [Tumebacillus sp. BK434]|uniref:hypothetical protein n=1 Tax=Tumebacillus sp. BK434 TaxID=2512169 RepID=UPI00104FFF0B|nr:hypothetical protein [Tumebacillus sp. BK434]TCP53714.1 hypothetical protein EV586_10558 [Tumebacillus sp. BK434]